MELCHVLGMPLGSLLRHHGHGLAHAAVDRLDNPLPVDRHGQGDPEAPLSEELGQCLAVRRRVIAHRDVRVDHERHFAIPPVVHLEVVLTPIAHVQRVVEKQVVAPLHGDPALGEADAGLHDLRVEQDPIEVGQLIALGIHGPVVRIAHGRLRIPRRVLAIQPRPQARMFRIGVILDLGVHRNG